MGVPASEVGYTPAMPRREDHEVHKGLWWHWEREREKKKGGTGEREKKANSLLSIVKA